MKRGAITFVFDDGYEQTHTNALPILSRYKLPGVFALPLDSNRVEASEKRAVRPWSAWLHVREQGHEIAAHSVTHVNLTTISADQLEQELEDPVEKLAAKTLIYPGGAHNAAVQAAAARYYVAARTLVRGLETLPPRNPHQIRSYDFTRRNFRVWKANLLALWAWVTNTWLVETYHIIDDNENEKEHAVATRAFARHVAFVAKLPIAVKTIQQVTSL